MQALVISSNNKRMLRRRYVLYTQQMQTGKIYTSIRFYALQMGHNELSFQQIDNVVLLALCF